MFTAVMSAFGVFCASAIIMYVIAIMSAEVIERYRRKKHKQAIYRYAPKRTHRFWL